jgi:hypothetical protein
LVYRCTVWWTTRLLYRGTFFPFESHKTLHFPPLLCVIYCSCHLSCVGSICDIRVCSVDGIILKGIYRSTWRETCFNATLYATNPT